MTLSEEKDHDHLHYHGVDKAEQHLSVVEALQTFLDEIMAVSSEIVEVQNSSRRILYSEVFSPTNLPRRPRSTRDGYAVNLPSGSLDFNSMSFRIIGEVRIGTISGLKLSENEAAKIATGAYIPEGANSVVMREYARIEDGMLRISKGAKIAENILSTGEDVNKGKLLVKRGTRLGSTHIALLSLVGVERVRVYSRPQVAVFSTGDELVDSKKTVTSPQRGSKRVIPGQTFDANRPFLVSAISALGGTPVDFGIARDNFEQIRSSMVKGLKSCDALILSAGSSVGERDYVSKAAESISGLKMLIHGVAMRPSSPTGLAVYRGKPIVFLPGFPTSAIVAFYVFALPALLKLSGSSSTELPMVTASITEGFEGRTGLTTFLRVRLTCEGGKYKAAIVRPTEAQYSSWLADANGIAVIGRDGDTKLRIGDEVPVWLINDVN